MRYVAISLCFLLALVVPPAAYSAPKWWEKGWPRKRLGSVAEAELLSQLAIILMPNSEIQELFRSFPSPEGWGGHALEPDLAAHGILKEKDAALFVEYDGFWRHGEEEGIVKDRNKNAALLSYAPKGSYVVRISHTRRKPLKRNVLWVKVETWRQGHPRSLLGTLKNAMTQISTGLADVLCPSYLKHLQAHGRMQLSTLSESGRQFAESAAIQMGGNSSEEVASFLKAEGFSAVNIKVMKMEKWFCCQSIEGYLKPKFRWLLALGLTKSQVAKAVATQPQILWLSIEQNLKPTVQWFLDLGLTKNQVAKAVATHPPILWLSIEQNLKPTVQWFLDLGLTKNQVAKAVATHPPILWLSIEQNLKPTVEWFLDLGLTKSQVVKAVATRPQILGLSIQENLKPTVQWFLDLGLTKSQVAKAVATFPPILWLSIEQNLKPTVQWFLDLELTKSQVAKAVASHPRILCYSTEQNLKPTVQWFLDLGLTKSEVAKAVSTCPQILGYSIEQNLDPKVEWLLEVGLSKRQLANALASSPQSLGLSLENNLKKKVTLMRSFLTQEEVAQQLAMCLPIFHSRYLRLKERLTILALHNRTSKLASAVTLTDEKFAKRYLA